jgi:DNA-directed RNA polymerase subunit K/omega
MNCDFTKYEKARIIGNRATQIAGGAPSTVNIDGLDDAIKIAEKEWLEGKIPLTLIRKFPNGKIINIDLTTGIKRNYI